MDPRRWRRGDDRHHGLRAARTWRRGLCGTTNAGSKNRSGQLVWHRGVGEGGKGDFRAGLGRSGGSQCRAQRRPGKNQFGPARRCLADQNSSRQSRRTQRVDGCRRVRGFHRGQGQGSIRLMRYLPKSPAEREQMLAAIGAKSIDELFSEIPERFRSEEHTSELQSRLHLVCRLLLEKKKITAKI